MPYISTIKYLNYLKKSLTNKTKKEEILLPIALCLIGKIIH